MNEKNFKKNNRRMTSLAKPQRKKWSKFLEIKKAEKCPTSNICSKISKSSQPVCAYLFSGTMIREYWVFEKLYMTGDESPGNVWFDLLSCRQVILVPAAPGHVFWYEFIINESAGTKNWNSNKRSQRPKSVNFP